MNTHIPSAGPSSHDNADEPLAVTIGASGFPSGHNRPRSLTQSLFEPTVALPCPLRFSARAALAGDFDTAQSLRQAEDMCVEFAKLAAPSPFCVRRWEVVLRFFGYPEHALLPLLDALASGATVDPAPDMPLGPRTWLPNHASAYAHTALLDAKLSKQVSEGTLLEWPAHLAPWLVSPLGAVVKFQLIADERAYDAWCQQTAPRLKAAAATDHAAAVDRCPLIAADLGVPEPPAPTGPSKVRVIHDARFGINDRGPAPKLGKLDTLRVIAEYARPGDYLWIEDLKGAYKQVRTIPWMMLLTCFSFLGRVFMDSRLTFGLNLSPYKYTACLGHPLLWVAVALTLRRSVLGHIFQYIDDHIGVSPSLKSAQGQRSCFREACWFLQAVCEDEKAVAPTQHGKVLGMILHTSPVVSVECPADKLERIRAVLALACGKGCFSRSELESVLGQIAFVAVSIRGAHIFTAELYTLLKASRTAPIINVSAAIQCDLAFWSDFAHIWNGVETIVSEPSLPAGHASADAMLEGSSAGIGLFLCGRGFHIPVDVAVLTGTLAKIAVLELIGFALLSVLVAAAFRGSVPHLASVVFPSLGDNTNVFHWIKKGRSNDDTANRILRFAWHVSSSSRVCCSLTWIPSEQNELADACSRNDQSRFSAAHSRYMSNAFPRAGPVHGWPACFDIQQPPSGEITRCLPGSCLHTLAAHLGGADDSRIPISAQQVDRILREVQMLFDQS